MIQLNSCCSETKLAWLQAWMQTFLSVPATGEGFGWKALALPS